MKIVYNIYKSIGLLPHMLPYYKKLGGIFFISDVNTYIRIKKEYPKLPITIDIVDIITYKPDITMYGDYTPMLGGSKNVKSVMIFHSIDLKGYYAIKKGWNLCECYNLCLLYGNKLLNEFKTNNWKPNYKIIGYPRFDNIASLPEKLFKNDRKIILIAPTWSNESLLKRFTNQLIELSNEYNVLVKLHSLIGTSKDNNTEFMKKLKPSNTLKILNNSDILPFMKNTDLLITDYSGCSCEYMYFDKPIIIADPKIALSKPDTWDVCKVCEDPTTLKDMVKQQLQKDEMKEKRNEYFRKLIYKDKNHTATELGVKAIEKLLEDDKNDK